MIRRFTFIRPAVARNLIAQVWTRLISNVGVRILQVPLLLSALGQDDYGRWLVISIIPAWLTLLNMGTGTVAGSDLVMEVAAGDHSQARRTYSNAMSLTFRIIGCSIPLLVAVIFIFPDILLQGMAADRRDEVVIGLLFLCIAVLITFISDIHATRLRAAGKADLAAFLLGGQLWMELGLILLVIGFSPRLDFLGAANLLSTIFYAITTWIMSRSILPQIRFDPRLSDRAGRWALLTKGAVYQSFPLGHAIILQGQILVVHQTIGAGAVAVFSTARTLVRLISQGLEMVNHSVWPEMSRLFGIRDMKAAARLHRTSVLSALFLSITGALCLWFFGPWLYSMWTQRMMVIDQRLMIPLLVAIPLGAVWYTSSMVALSSNKYEGMAKRFLLASFLAHLCCWWFSLSFGLPGAALSTLIADAIMIPYVLNQSLKLTADNGPGVIGRLISDIRHRS